MSWTVAYIFFNPIFESRLAQFIEHYGHICTQVKPLLGDYFQNEVKNNVYGVEAIMKMVQDDFKSRERRLLLIKEDDKLFLDKDIFNQGFLIRRLELRKLWKHEGTDKLTTGDKKQIWQVLKCFWLLAQATLILPEEVCERLERMAICHSATINDPSFDPKKIAQECKDIIYKVKSAHFHEIIKWGQKLVFAPYTPVIELLPNNYAGLGRRLHNLIRDDEYKELIFDSITPLMYQVTNTAQQQGIALIEGGMNRPNGMAAGQQDEDDDSSDDDVATNGQKTKKKPKGIAAYFDQDFSDDVDAYDFEKRDALPGPDGQPVAQNQALAALTPGGPSEADQQRVNYIIDVLFAILIKNTKSVKLVSSNPGKIFEVLFNQDELKRITNDISRDLEELKIEQKQAQQAGIGLIDLEAQQAWQKQNPGQVWPGQGATGPGGTQGAATQPGQAGKTPQDASTSSATMMWQAFALRQQMMQAYQANQVANEQAASQAVAQANGGANAQTGQVNTQAAVPSTPAQPVQAQYTQVQQTPGQVYYPPAQQQYYAPVGQPYFAPPLKK